MAPTNYILFECVLNGTFCCSEVEVECPQNHFQPLYINPRRFYRGILLFAPFSPVLYFILHVACESIMAQIRGTAGYNLGAQDRFGGPGRADATNDPSPLDAIREQTSKIEDWLDTLSDPVKP